MSWVGDRISLIVCRTQVDHRKTSNDTADNFDCESSQSRSDRQVVFKIYSDSYCMNSYCCVTCGVDLDQACVLINEEFGRSQS